MYILSFLVFLPIFFAILILILPQAYAHRAKYLALLAVTLQLLITFILYFNLKAGEIAHFGQFQWQERMVWINMNLGDLGILQIEYLLGVDGLSMPLILLTTIIMWIAVLASLNNDHYNKSYYALLMLSSTSIVGVFLALDFFLFFIFYELMLLPLYFLIGIWGGERREYAAIKFFLYTLFGSVFMLLVLIVLSLSVRDPITGFHTLNLTYLSDIRNTVVGSILHPQSHLIFLGMSARTLAFTVLFVAFAIKIPIVPLHTWLPDAHVEAPTPISIILAGIMLKVGAYGLLRIVFPIFPDVVPHMSWFLGLLAVVSILYGAFNALAMTDLKRLIAYSSISHMGFVLLGIISLTSEGVNGAIFQLFSHGILSAMLFFLVGVLYDRVHNRQINNFSGLASLMPNYTAMVALAFFASLGLPGFSAFIGELFTLLGAFDAHFSHNLPLWMPILSVFGILLSAAYFLWTLQRMFFGKLILAGGDQWQSYLFDITYREFFILIVLSSVTLAIGLCPSLIFNLTNSYATTWLSHLL